MDHGNDARSFWGTSKQNCHSFFPPTTGAAQFLRPCFFRLQQTQCLPSPVRVHKVKCFTLVCPLPTEAAGGAPQRHDGGVVRAAARIPPRAARHRDAPRQEAPVSLSVHRGVPRRLPALHPRRRRPQPRQVPLHQVRIQGVGQGGSRNGSRGGSRRVSRGGSLGCSSDGSRDGRCQLAAIDRGAALALEAGIRTRECDAMHVGSSVVPSFSFSISWGSGGVRLGSNGSVWGNSKRTKFDWGLLLGRT